MSLLRRSVPIITLVLLLLVPRVEGQLASSKGTLRLTNDVGVQIGAKPISVDFSWSGRSSGVEAFLVVYPSTSSRYQLSQTLRSGPSGSPLALSRPHSLAFLATPHGYRLSSRIFSAISCGAACAGVYPVELRLASSQTGVTLSQVIVGVPYFPSSSSITTPLGVAPILRMQLSTPSKQLRAALSRLSSSTAAATISLAGSVGTSIATQKGYARLLGSASLHQRILSPYAVLAPNCANLVVSPLIGLESRLKLSGQINGTASRTAVFAQAPTRLELGELRRDKINTTVVPDGVLSQLASVLSVSDPAYVHGLGLTVLGSSRQLSAEFASANTPGGYQRLLADLAQFYFQAPAQSGRVATMEIDLTTAAQVAGATTVLERLQGTPIFSMMTVARAATLPSSHISQSDLRLASAPKRHCTITPKAVRQGLTRLGALASADTGSRSGLEGLVGLAQLATSGNKAIGQRAISLLDQQERGLLAQVQLVGSKTITLTSHSVSVPLTLSSKLPFPIGVQLSIRSSEITFPKGSRRVIKLRRGTATVSLPVVVKALGTFAASAVVSAPNGAVLVTSNLTVHSTGFSTVGVVLTVGAALVLVSWWVRTARHHRKKTSD